jgi:hypothetical protein
MIFERGRQRYTPWQPLPPAAQRGGRDCSGATPAREISVDKLPHPQRLVCALLLLPAVCPGLACPTLAAAQADNTNDPLWADRLSYGDQGLQYEDATRQ